MNLIKLLLATLISVGSIRAAALFDQNEVLVVDQKDTLIGLKPYFSTRPKLFGLVSNKTRSFHSGGHLCYARSFDEFSSGCNDKLVNADWVTLVFANLGFRSWSILTAINTLHNLSEHSMNIRTTESSSSELLSLLTKTKIEMQDSIERSWIGYMFLEQLRSRG